MQYMDYGQYTDILMEKLHLPQLIEKLWAFSKNGLLMAPNIACIDTQNGMEVLHFHFKTLLWNMA